MTKLSGALNSLNFYLIIKPAFKKCGLRAARGPPGAIPRPQGLWAARLPKI